MTKEGPDPAALRLRAPCRHPSRSTRVGATNEKDLRSAEVNAFNRSLQPAILITPQTPARDYATPEQDSRWRKSRTAASRGNAEDDDERH